MFFLATQIFVWIIAAFVFGAIVGWWLHIYSEKDIEQPMSMTAGNSSNSGSISVLSDSLLKSQRELKACQESLAAAKSQLRELDIFTEEDEEEPPSSESSFDVPFENMDPDPPSLSLDQVEYGDAEVDDLTLIRGIGPVTERRLQELNIHTYRQIAELTAGEIAELGTKINFSPGRIERDGWVENARRLHQEKYGEKV